MPFQSEKQRKYLHANHPDIAKRWEKEYATGGISNLFKNRTGFHRGSLRHQKEHDYKSYEDEGSFMKYLALSGDQAKVHSPESGAFGSFLFRPDPDERMSYRREIDDFETMMKERFMYGEHKIPSNFEQVWSDIKKLLDKKRNKHATGGISNHFKLKDGGRIGFDTGGFTQDDFDRFLKERKQRDKGKLKQDILKDWEDWKKYHKDITMEVAQGGLIPSHEAGIYGLAEGGQLVKPGPGRPGYGGHLGHQQAPSAPESSSIGGEGYQNVHQTGAVTQTPGRPTVSTTAASEDAYVTGDTITSLTSTTDDGLQRNVHFDTPEILEEQRKLDLQQMVRDQSEKTETWEKEQQWNKPKMPFWKKILVGAAIITGVAPLLGFQAPAAVRTVAQFNALHNKANKALSLFNQVNNTNYTLEGLYADMKTKTAEKRKTDKAEQDLINSLPEGHPERIQLEGLKKETPDDVPDRDGVIQETSIKIENIEEVNDKKAELASIEANKILQDVRNAKRDAYLAAFRQKYLMGPSAMAAEGGRVPAAYNTGGLSNLFRLKNI